LKRVKTKSPKALASWIEKDADPGIAEVDDDMKRLAGLKVYNS